MRRPLTTAIVAGWALVAAGSPAQATGDGVDVTGTVYLDLDRDGSRDADEPGRASVPVTLRTESAILDAVTTDDGGTFRFARVASGTYTVVADPPGDLRTTSGTGGVRVQVDDADVDDAAVFGLGSKLTSGPDLAVAVRLDQVQPDQTAAAWTVDVQNLGDEAIDGPTSVRVVLGGGHAVASTTGSGWVCEAGTSIITCDHGDGLAASSVLPPLRLRSTLTGSPGTQFTATATARVQGFFDAAPLNDEDAAGATIGTTAAAPDTDGDGVGELSETGLPLPAGGALGLLGLVSGAIALRTSRRR